MLKFQTNVIIIISETDKSRNNSVSILFSTMELRTRRPTEIDGEKSWSNEQDWGRKGWDRNEDIKPFQNHII